MYTSPTQSPKHGLIIKPSQTQHSDLEKSSSNYSNGYLVDHKYFCFVFSKNVGWDFFFLLSFYFSTSECYPDCPNRNPNPNSSSKKDMRSKFVTSIGRRLT